MIKVIYSLVVAVVIAVHTVSGNRAGAPLPACVTLTPQHSDVAQVTPSPHIVDLSNFDSTFNESSNTTTLYYIPNTMYSITLVATGVGVFSDVFRGFLLQGRTYADDSVVGTFMAPPPGALYRLSSCQRSDGSVTHNSNAAKTNITVYWMSPAAGTGPVYFGHAFVWRFSTFWADLQTAPLLEAGEINELPTAEATTPTQTLTETATISEILTPTIVMTTSPVEITATPPIVTATPPIVTVTPPEEITTPPIVTATLPEEITTPPIVTATLPEEITTPPEEIATPSVMMPSATPDDEVTGGATGLTVGTFMISLAVTLTISLVANVIN